MEAIKELLNNDAFIIGTTIFLAGIAVAILGYVDLKLKRKWSKA